MNDNKAPLPMKQLIIFVIFSIAVIVGWNYIQDKIWPRQKLLKPADQRAIAQHISQLGFMAPSGAGIGDLARFAGNEIGRELPDAAKKKALAQYAEGKKKENEAKVAQLPKVPEFKPTLIDLGDKDHFKLQVRLTSKGGGVDRVIVNDFEEANRNGKAVEQADGTPEKLHLIPSTADIPKVERDNMPHELTLPSFLIYHYATPDDPRPENYLGELAWKVIEPPGAKNSERQQAEFSAEVPELGVKFTKTYTLEPRVITSGWRSKSSGCRARTPSRFATNWRAHMAFRWKAFGTPASIAISSPAGWTRRAPASAFSKTTCQSTRN